MSAGSEQQGQPGNEGVDADVRTEGDDGRRASQATPPIADDATPEQTQTAAAADDVGVPPDGEMGRDDG